jgi:hypothetical protein
MTRLSPLLHLPIPSFAALALVGAAAVAPICLAQPTLTPAIDAAVGLTRAPVDTWRDVRALSPSLTLDSPWLSAFAAGDVAAGSSALRGLGWRGTMTASTPSVGGFHLSASGAFAAGRDASALALPGTTTDRVRRFAGSGQLAYRRERGGLWLGIDALAGDPWRLVPDAPAGAADTMPGATHTAANMLGDARSHLSAGVWRSLGRAVATVEVRSGITRAPGRESTLGTRRVIAGITRRDTLSLRMDTSWVNVDTGQAGRPGWARRGTDVEARLAWQRGRVALTTIAGLQLLEWRSTPEGAPLARVGRRGWAGVDATVGLGARVALVAAGGTRPRDDVAAMLTGAAPWRPTERSQYATLALRLSPSFFARPALPPVVRPAAAAFDVQKAGGGRYALRVRVPAARIVELSGDFTGWQPVAMRRAAADVWEALVPMSPGTHHLNIRVDGDAWRAPPGTTTVADDFNGTVGVIVVQP